MSFGLIMKSGHYEWIFHSDVIPNKGDTVSLWYATPSTGFMGYVDGVVMSRSFCYSPTVDDGKDVVSLSMELKEQIPPDSVAVSQGIADVCNATPSAELLNLANQPKTLRYRQPQNAGHSV